MVKHQKATKWELRLEIVLIASGYWIYLIISKMFHDYPERELTKKFNNQTEISLIFFFGLFIFEPRRN